MLAEKKICVNQRVFNQRLSAGNHFLRIMTENEISYIIRGYIFKVFNSLGAGLLESAYAAALCFEIKRAGLLCVTQAPLPMIYENVKVDIGYRLDLLIENKVIIE